MENQKDPLPSPEDNLQAENNLLKLKLGVEHGMQMSDLSELDPAVENEWLKSVYAFEQNFKDAKTTKFYDYIGRPAFRKWDTLSPEETRKELERLELLMEHNDVQLDCICKYDDAVIYRFITEELFHHEMNDMRIAGMTWHFTYEEFHPNHDYDLREYISRFVESVFTRPWDEEFDGMHVAPLVSFSGNEHDRRSISSVIRVFQEAHRILNIETCDIKDVCIDSTLTSAVVHASVGVSGKMKGGDDVRYEGVCAFHFTRSDGYWYIARFSLPGFTDVE